MVLFAKQEPQAQRRSYWQGKNENIFRRVDLATLFCLELRIAWACYPGIEVFSGKFSERGV
jgi:hypothetical protein